MSAAATAKPVVQLDALKAVPMAPFEGTVWRSVRGGLARLPTARCPTRPRHGRRS